MKNKKYIIIGNWKMNKSKKDAINFCNSLNKIKISNDDIKFGVAVPYLYLDALIMNQYSFIVSAQNCNPNISGAFTGEISYSMLKDIGVKYCIIGHSERRQLFNETNEFINKKILKLLNSNIKPILCIGETNQEYLNNKTKDVLENQLSLCLKDVSKANILDLVIAYEPIWAIGTGNTATSEQINGTIKFIRKIIEKLYDYSVSQEILIQYGGSVKLTNAKEILMLENVNGALIGGASLDVEVFKKIIEII